MKRRNKPGKPSVSKRPNDQKLIETFLLLNQAKTEIKSNNIITKKKRKRKTRKNKRKRKRKE